MTINSRFRLAALLALACVTLLSGCAGTKTPTSYYSLYAPASQIAGATPAQGDLSVSVGPVSIPDILKQTRIATGGENGSFRLSEFHRWSGDVDRDLGRTLAEHLSRGARNGRSVRFSVGSEFHASVSSLRRCTPHGRKPWRRSNLECPLVPCG
jgi:Uncharacterized protein conserved in bacteria